MGWLFVEGCPLFMFFGIFCKSATYVKGDNFLAKKSCEYLVGNKKSSTFAPAIERDAVQIEMLKAKLGFENHIKKNFFEKTSKKFW